MKTKTLFLCLALGLFGAHAHAGTSADTALPAANSLVYSYDEMFHFDIDAFLQTRAPALASQAEAISHWAGYSSISPRVLIALMEQQTGAISRAQKGVPSRPFGNLSRANGFAEQVRDVAHQLATKLYARAAAPGAAPSATLSDSAEFAASASANNPLHALFENRMGIDANLEQNLADFAQTYQRLFGSAFNMNGTAAALYAPSLAGPANGVLNFPFPAGATWYVGGAHTDTGQGNYPLSSLDMSLGGGWGSNQSNVWATAAAGGTFKRHSSCFAEIVHANGWSTTHYHLMNIQYNTGASVAKGARIANPANTQAQALCNGGHSTGPHEHWSLKSNGSYYHLNGVYVSGWQISATGTSYDTNCSRFYLTRNGSKRCAGSFTNN
jgi:LasA protease